MKGTEDCYSLQTLIGSRAFIIGFLGAYTLFFVLTLWVFDFATDGPVLSTEYGVPFTYFISHCFGGTYIYSGLLGNILFAALIASIVGIFCAYVWKTLGSEDFRRKWNL